MILQSAFSAAVTLVVCLDYASSIEFLRVCYFPSWANVRESPQARFDIRHVNPNLCTHLIYAFGKLDRESKLLVPADSWLEDSRPGHIGRYREFNDLKRVNKGLRTLLSVGGQNDYGEGFKAVTESVEVLKRFAETTVDFLRKRNFDGLDIDWEYPDKSTRVNLVNLLKALRDAFDGEKADEKLLLSLAGAAGLWHIDDGYDIPNVARYVDYVNLMTYDYAVKTNVVTAFNSPLFSRNNIQFNPTLSVNWTVHYWRDHGMPSSKMLVGLTGVGRRLVLANPSMTSVGSPVTGQVRVGDYYRLEAGLAYPEICIMLSDPAARREFDTQQQGVYLVKGDDWVGYDDKDSITAKIKWALGQGLAGIMFWSLDQDDFSGQMCGSGEYPLLRTINAALGIAVTPVVTPRTTLPTTTSENSATVQFSWSTVINGITVLLLLAVFSLSCIVSIG